MKKIINNWKLIITLLAFFGLASCSNIPVEENSKTSYVVQLVATNNLSKANSIRNTFVKEGYKNTSVNSITRDGKKIHRVQIGPYGKKADGEKVLMQMKKRYLRNQYVKNAVVKTVYGK